MNVEIRPEAVRKIRARKGFSRAELAHQAKMSGRQIARIESSKESKKTVREHTVKILARAFRVSRDVLEGKEPLEGILEGMSAKPAQKKALAKLSPELQKDFDRVAIHYRVKEDELIALAPLMFTILAEGTIAWHDEKEKRVKALMDEVFDHAGLKEIVTREKLEDDVSDAHFFLYPNHARNSLDDLSVSHESIFGFSGYCEDYLSSVNPFIFYLHNLIKEIGTDKAELFVGDIYAGQKTDFAYSLLGDSSGLPSETSEEDQDFRAKMDEAMNRFYHEKIEESRKEGDEEGRQIWEDNLYWHEVRRRVRRETDSNDVSTQSQHEPAEESIQDDSLEKAQKNQGETND